MISLTDPLNAAVSKSTFKYDFNLNSYLTNKLGCALSALTLEVSLDPHKMYEYLLSKFSIQVISKVQDKIFNNSVRKIVHSDIANEFITDIDTAMMLILDDQIGLEYSYLSTYDNQSESSNNITTGTIRFLYPYGKHDLIVDTMQYLIDNFMVYSEREESEDGIPMISLINSGQQGYYMDEIDLRKSIGKIENDMFDVHYGKGFTEFSDTVIEYLTHENKGLFIFHGKPGTGKTHYIRYLLSKIYNIGKEIIYVPSNYIDNLLDPTFITFLTNHIKKSKYGSIILLEDAESLILDRDTNARSLGVSNLLNLTDGIINDMLGVQVIITFNTELEYIDTALLRPERLLARKEFKSLSKDQAALIIDKLSLNIEAVDDMTIADIYSSHKKRKIIVHDINTEKNNTPFGFA